MNTDEKKAVLAALEGPPPCPECGHETKEKEKTGPGRKPGAYSYWYACDHCGWGDLSSEKWNMRTAPWLKPVVAPILEQLLARVQELEEARKEERGEHLTPKEGM